VIYFKKASLRYRASLVCQRGLFPARFASLKCSSYRLRDFDPKKQSLLSPDCLQRTSWYLSRIRLRLPLNGENQVDSRNKRFKGSKSNLN